MDNQYRSVERMLPYTSRDGISAFTKLPEGRNHVINYIIHEIAMWSFTTQNANTQEETELSLFNHERISVY